MFINKYCTALVVQPCTWHASTRRSCKLKTLFQKFLPTTTTMTATSITSTLLYTALEPDSLVGCLNNSINISVNIHDAAAAALLLLKLCTFCCYCPDWAIATWLAGCFKVQVFHAERHQILLLLNFALYFLPIYYHHESE